MNLADALRELRETARLSQRALAERLGVNSSYVSHLESGRREPSLSLLRQLARELNAPLGLLVGACLLPDLPEDEQATYRPILNQLLELSKSRQLDLPM